MLITISGSTKLERQKELYKLLSEKLIDGNMVYMLSTKTWQDTINGIFTVPEFNIDRLRTLQNDEFVLFSTAENDRANINIKNYYEYYNVFILDGLEIQMLNAFESTISKIESSMQKILIINN